MPPQAELFWPFGRHAEDAVEWENARRVREPVAWILIILTCIGLLIGFWTLVGLPGAPIARPTTFHVRAGSAVNEFVGMDTTLLPVFAVLLVTIAGGVTERAGRVMLVAVTVQSLAFGLGLISLVGSLGPGNFGVWFYLSDVRLLGLAAAGLILTSALYLSWTRRTGGNRRR
jgi:hypothetical protein